MSSYLEKKSFKGQILSDLSGMPAHFQECNLNNKSFYLIFMKIFSPIQIATILLSHYFTYLSDNALTLS